MPANTWLVDNIIPSGSLASIYGASGSFKSFQALDIAMSVGAGMPWQGHEVEQGPAVYISAEGGRGLGKRALAWLTHRGIPSQHVEIAWLVEALPISPTSEEIEILLNRVKVELEYRPSLVVIDTLARCFEGGENETEDMNQFVAGVDRFRHELGSAVLVVHHTRLGGDRERGNTAFRGAADTMILAEKSDESITLKCDKQRDDDPFEDIELDMIRVEGTDSIVFGPGQVEERKNERLEQAVLALAQKGPSRWEDWKTATGLTQSQMLVLLPRLKIEGLVEKQATGLWRVKP